MDLPPPLTISILAYFTFVFTLSFTPPFSHVRLAIFALMLSYIPLVLWPSTPSFSIPLYTSLAGGSVFSFVLQFMDQIVLGQWSSNVKGPNCARGGQQPTSERTWAKGEMKTTQRSSKMLEQFYWANTHVFDSRFVNTLWEVANVPPFSQYDRQQVPTKIQFLRKNSTICLVCFLLLDLTRLLAAPPEQNAILFAEERVGFLRRLGEVSAEELILRFVSAGMYWAITFLLFQGVHSGTGVLMVGLGISEVEMWRPFFGRLQDAWSLRQFWGSFWHQSLRQSLTSPARLVTRSVFGLRNGRLLRRYLFIFLTFGVSGMLHLCADVASGLSWRDSGAVQFFSVQSLGILLEDAVQATYQSVITRKEKAIEADVSLSGRSTGPLVWERMAGYVWVAVWMAWSVPVYTYPVARRSHGGGILPFSVVDRFL